MKGFFLLLLSLLLISVCQAQIKPFEIGLSYETMKLSSLPIRVVEVIDGRDSTANIGWVWKGVKKVQRPALFEKGFNRELFTFFRKYIQKSENPYSLLVRVSELRISELTDNKETVAEAGMELEFFLQKDSNSYYFLTRIPSLTRYKGMIDKFAHTYNIVDGFKYIFKQLDTLNFESRIKPHFLVTREELISGTDSAGILEAHHAILEEPPHAGIYVDFLEFSHNAPSRHDELYIVEKERREKGWEGEYIITPYLKVKDRRLRKVWGFSDGKQVYLLFNQVYWPVILENGYAYFYAVQSAQYSLMPAILGASFGLVGGLIGGVAAGAMGPKVQPGKVIHIINMATGRIEMVVQSGE